MQKHGAQVWLKQTSSSHKLEKLVAQTCPSCHDFRILSTHSSPFITIQHPSWIILDHLGSSWRPDFASRNSKFASSNFFSFFSKDSSESLDHSWTTVVGAGWPMTVMSWKVLKSPPIWIPNIGPNISNMQEYAGYFMAIWGINQSISIILNRFMLNDACLLVHAVELTSGRNSQEHNRSTSWYADKWQATGYPHFVLSQFVFARFPTTPTRSYTSCQCVVEISLDLSNASPIQNHWADKRRC